MVKHLTFSMVAECGVKSNFLRLPLYYFKATLHCKKPPNKNNAPAFYKIAHTPSVRDRRYTLRAERSMASQHQFIPCCSGNCPIESDYFLL